MVAQQSLNLAPPTHTLNLYLLTEKLLLKNRVLIEQQRIEIPHREQQERRRHGGDRNYIPNSRSCSTEGNYQIIHG